MKEIYIILSFFICFSCVSCKLYKVARKQNVISVKNFMFWPNATVPFYINPEHFDHQQSLAILTALSMFAFKTCMKFAPVMALPNSNEHVLVFINPAGVKRCVYDSKGHSVLGPHLVTLGYDCLKSPHIEMAIMKTLGFPFEHNRANRDEYITIMMENIDAGAVEFFTKDTNEPVEFRLLPYDINSVMHFGNREFSKNGHRTIVFKDGTIQQNRIGLTTNDIRKFDIVYGPECLKRDRQEKIELCQSYPNVARRKRDTIDVNDENSDKNDQKNDANDKLTKATDLNSDSNQNNTATGSGDKLTEKSETKDDTQATKSLRVNPNITPPPNSLYIPQNLHELGIEEQVQTIVENVYKVSAIALQNARLKYCKVTEKVELRTRGEDENMNDVLGIINLVSEYAQNMVDNAMANLTIFCDDSGSITNYERQRCKFSFGGNPRCTPVYRSTNYGMPRHSTQHRPFIQQSTKHWSVNKVNIYHNMLRSVNNTGARKKREIPTQKETLNLTRTYEEATTVTMATDKQEIVRENSTNKTIVEETTISTEETLQTTEPSHDLEVKKIENSVLRMGTGIPSKLDRRSRRADYRSFEKSHPEDHPDSAISLEKNTKLITEKYEISHENNIKIATKKREISQEKDADLSIEKRVISSKKDTKKTTENHEISSEQDISTGKHEISLDKDIKKPSRKHGKTHKKLYNIQAEDGDHGFRPGPIIHPKRKNYHGIESNRKWPKYPAEEIIQKARILADKSRMFDNFKNDMSDTAVAPSRFSVVRPKFEGIEKITPKVSFKKPVVQSWKKMKEHKDFHDTSSEEGSNEDRESVRDHNIERDEELQQDHNRDRNRESKLEQDRNKNKKIIRDGNKDWEREEEIDREWDHGVRDEDRAREQSKREREEVDRNIRERDRGISRDLKRERELYRDRERDSRIPENNRESEEEQQRLKKKKWQRDEDSDRESKKQEEYRSEQSDAVLPPTVKLSKLNKEFYRERRWPGGIVRYMIKPGLRYDYSDIRNRLEEVNAILKKRTCVRLEEIKEAESEQFEDFLVLDNSPDYVTGRVGGKQNFGCVELLEGGQHRQHTAMMVMAMLGFYFEVSRHDRDEYIRVHQRHVRPDKLHHFEKIRSDATLAVPYDYASATHPAWQFWRQFGVSGISSVATFKQTDPDGSLMKSLGQNRKLLSDTDILKINSVYGVRCFMRGHKDERPDSENGRKMRSRNRRG